MADLNDQEFTSLFDEKPDAALATDAQTTDEQFKGMFDDNGSKNAAIPSNKILYGEAAPWVEYYSNKLKGGEVDVTRMNMGLKAQKGSVLYEDIKDDASVDNLKQQTNAFEKNLSPWDARGWVGTALQSVPFMREATLGGAKGLVLGAAAGAGTAAVAGQLGPQVALPEELVTVPGGAALGARWGYQAGQFATSASLMSGGLYLDLRDAGVKHETAKWGAAAGGIISGLIESAELNQLSALGRKQFVAQLKTHSGKQAMMGFARNYLKQVGTEVGEEELQSVTEIASQAISGLVDKNPKAIPTMDQIREKLTQTLVQSAQASAVFAGGSQITGGAAGAITKNAPTIQSFASQLLQQQRMQEAISNSATVQKGVQVAAGIAKSVADGKMNLQSAMRLVGEAMDKQHPTEEQKAEAAAIPVKDILDSLSDPSGPNDVKPLKAGISVVQQLVNGAEQQSADNQQISLANQNGTIYADAGIPAEPDTQLPNISLPARAAKVDEHISALDKQIDETEKQIQSRDLPGAQQRQADAESAYNQARTIAERLEKKYNNKETKGNDTQAVLDKLEEAYTNEQAALKELRAAKAAVTRINPKQTATGALTNRLNRLYEQRATLETERSLLHEGLLKPEEIKNAQVKMTVGQLLAQRAKAVRKILKAFALGHREGVKFTRSEVKEVQRELTSLITTSDLTAKDKAKFLDSIRTVQTPRQLVSKIPKILNRINQLTEAEDRRNIKRQLARVFKQISLAKSGKRAVGKFGQADTQHVLNTYRRAILDPKWRADAIQSGMALFQNQVNLASQAIQSQNPTVADYNLTDDRDAMTTMVAQRVGDFENKTVQAQQELVDEIKDIMKTGRAEKLQQKLDLAEQRKQAVGTALESIQGNKPLDSTNPANSKMALNTPQNALIRLKRTLGRTLNSWNGLMEILSQHDLSQQLVKLADIHKPMVREITNAKKYREKLINTLVEAVGKNPKAVLDRIVSGSKKETLDAYTNQDGETVPLIISRNEGIKLWAQMHDTDLEMGLREGNKYTFPDDVQKGQVSTYEVLDKYLSPDDKALAAGLTKFYTEYYNRVNKAWEEETGASLTRNDNYSGLAKRTTQNKQTATGSFFDEQFARSTLKPASTISRTANSNPLALSDAFLDALEHVTNFEHWIAWKDSDKVLRNVFSNPEVRDAIKLKYGAGMMRTVDDRYNDLIGTRQEQLNDAFKWVDRIRLNAGTAFVGGKALSFFKQWTAAVNFMIYVSPAEMAGGVIDFMLHPKLALETMEKSELLKNRIETFDRDFKEALSRDDITTLKRRPKTLEVVMWYTKYGDRIAIWTGGWAVYKAAINKGATHEEALTAFEKAFNRTQQSGTPDSMSQLERAGSFGKILTVFTKQNLQMLEIEANSIRAAMSNPTKANVLTAMKRVAVVHTSAMLFQTMGSLIPFATGDEEEQKEEALKTLRALILGPFMGLGLLGDTINSGATVVTNWTFDAHEKIWAPSFLPADAVGRIYSLFKRTFKALTEGGTDFEDVCHILKDYSRGVDLLLPPQLGGGVPKEPAINFAQWLFTGNTGNEDKKK